LLPRATLPLNVFEPRYLALVDAALANARMIGIVQPVGGDQESPPGEPPLESVGCAGRLIAFAEQPDGRCLITVTGVCRFRTGRELAGNTAFRRVQVAYDRFAGDLAAGEGSDAVDRPALLRTLADYLKAKHLDIEWEQVAHADNETLVNALSMMSPFGHKEKQALLEAETLKERADILVALTEMALAQTSTTDDSRLQ
jgi:Lon protease-like protein